VPEVAPARSWARFSESLLSCHSSSFQWKAVLRDIDLLEGS
jgi:hypothetical protein